MASQEKACVPLRCGEARVTGAPGGIARVTAQAAHWAVCVAAARVRMRARRTVAAAQLALPVGAAVRAAAAQRQHDGHRRRGLRRTAALRRVGTVSGSNTAWQRSRRRWGQRRPCAFFKRRRLSGGRTWLDAARRAAAAVSRPERWRRASARRASPVAVQPTTPSRSTAAPISCAAAEIAAASMFWGLSGVCVMITVPMGHLRCPLGRLNPARLPHDQVRLVVTWWSCLCFAFHQAWHRATPACGRNFLDMCHTKHIIASFICERPAPSRT